MGTWGTTNLEALWDHPTHLYIGQDVPYVTWGKAGVNNFQGNPPFLFFFIICS